MENGTPTKENYIRINITDIEKINQFKYLRSIINNNIIISEINHRINMGNKCCYGLRNRFGLKLLKLHTKCTGCKH